MRKIIVILSATMMGLLGCGGDEKANFKVSGQQFMAVDFSKDGSILAGIGKDGAINFWDPIKQKQILVVSAGDKRPTTLAFNPDGKTLALGHLDGDIRLIRTDDGEELQTVKTGNGQIKSMSFSGDGKYLALARKSSLEILPSSSFKKVKALIVLQRLMLLPGRLMAKQFLQDALIITSICSRWMVEKGLP